MPQAFYILFGALYTLAVCYALGRMLLNGLGIRLYRDEQRLLSLYAGAACLHLLVFLLASLHWARKGVFLWVGAAALLIGWLRGPRLPAPLEAFPPASRLWKLLFAGVWSAYALLYVVNAMAPEMSPDGSGYHLGLVSRYLRERGFARITTNMYANLTQGVEMLYLFAFAFGRHSAASLVHCAFTLTLPLLMIAHARRFGFPVAGFAGAILVLCAPVTGVAGTTAYNDVAVTAVVFATFSLASIWSRQRQPQLLIPTGLLAGFCFAAKYTAALAALYVGGVVLWRSLRTGSLARNLVWVAAPAGLMAAPWMVKNAIVVGNPLSPFANRLFPNPNVRISFEQEYIQHMRRYGEIQSWREIPPDLLVRGERLAGMLGPVFMFLPVGLLALRLAEGRRLLAAGALLLLPYFNNIGTRFLLPSLPFFSLAFALACARTPGVLPVIVMLHALLSWPHVLRKYSSPFAWRLNALPVAAALRIGKEEQYLAKNFPGYIVARMVEDAVPATDKVFTYSGIPEAYTSREILVGYQSGFNNTMSDIIYAALFADYAPTRHLHFRFPRQPLRKLKLVQTAAGGTDHWSVTEFRLLDGGQQLPRRPHWRLRASPNPWEVQLAFDNSPVTRWQSWEAIRSGMLIEVDLAEETAVDGVLLETTKDQYQVRMKLYGQRAHGPWMLLADKYEEAEVPVMKGLRRAAMEELLARGVNYLLVAPQDPGAEDFRTNQRAWGIRQIGERFGTRLYRIEGTQP